MQVLIIPIIVQNLENNLEMFCIKDLINDFTNMNKFQEFTVLEIPIFHIISTAIASDPHTILHYHSSLPVVSRFHVNPKHRHTFKHCIQS